MNVLSLFKKNKFSVIVLALIMLVGIFLRTYHLHDWLFFYPDQVRDLSIVEEVVNGGDPWPTLGSQAGMSRFRIGPMYNYFQIIAGKMFGVVPEVMAYPDVFFSILSIPLLYFFLRRYFADKLSLGLTGLYALSFYDVYYSRFAWNSNPIPFFVFLFLLGCHELLEKKERTSWLFVAAVGIALGVGVQLHTILLVLLPLFFLILSCSLVMSSPRVWLKCLAILAIAFVLNVPQIVSDARGGFVNAQLFFKVSDRFTNNGEGSFLANLNDFALCHMQADAQTLTSLGNWKECDYQNIIVNKGEMHSGFARWAWLTFILFNAVFLLWGYCTLVYRLFREGDDTRKNFLKLTALFTALSFVIMLPIVSRGEIRYFFHIIFVPFLFLGFLVEALPKQYPRFFTATTMALFLFCVAANGSTFFSQGQELVAERSSYAMNVILGEAELMQNFMVQETLPGKEALLFAQGKYLQNFSAPLIYLAQKQGITLGKMRSLDRLPAGLPLFYLTQSAKDDDGQIVLDRQVIGKKIFGQIIIYQLQN